MEQRREPKPRLWKPLDASVPEPKSQPVVEYQRCIG
jgi:hypothetical protein